MGFHQHERWPDKWETRVCGEASSSWVEMIVQADLEGAAPWCLDEIRVSFLLITISPERIHNPISLNNLPRLYGLLASIQTQRFIHKAWRLLAI